MRKFQNGYFGETEADALFSEYSDLHKDVVGVRPRGFTTLPSCADLRQMIGDLEEEAYAMREHEDMLAQDAAEDTQPCVDCGDPNAFDDWECREGVWRCCDCNAATFKGVRVPREWID